MEPDKQPEPQQSPVFEPVTPALKPSDKFRFSKREIVFIIIIVLLLAAAGLYAWRVNAKTNRKEESINSFQECVNAGKPVMESYPERCSANGRTFTKPR
ncbi:MAG: hypothetical protein WAQ57_00575 [Candidatus Saccharimonadales bacterium]